MKTRSCAEKVALLSCMLWVFFGSYQYPENPQVDPVVLVQPLAVDLEPLAGKK